MLLSTDVPDADTPRAAPPPGGASPDGRRSTAPPGPGARPRWRALLGCLVRTVRARLRPGRGDSRADRARRDALRFLDRRRRRLRSSLERDGRDV